MKATSKDYFLLNFLVLIFGFTAIMGLLISLPALELVFYRTLLASILLAIFFRKKIFPLKISGRIYRGLILTGMTISGHWIFFFLSARVSTASICLAGMATTALWTAILEPIFFKRRFSFLDFGFGLSVFLGLWVIFRFEFDHALGLALAIISAFLAALFSILNALFIQKVNEYKITYVEMFVATICTLIAIVLHGLFVDGSFRLELISHTMDWVYLFILAGVCTVYAFSESVELMKRMAPFTVNLTLNLEPVYGIVLALIVFGEQEKMSWGFYAGTLFILVNLIAYPYIKKRKKLKFF